MTLGYVNPQGHTLKGLEHKSACIVDSGASETVGYMT
jgi:hypothetical protein